MTSPPARRAHAATNLLHSFVYFAPEAEQELVGVGLEPGRMCYFASRSAPMGAVGAGVVAATFSNFNPALVARYIPRAWSLASPPVVVTARLAAADAGLRRLLGAELLASDDLVALAGLARAATSACRVEGRPLYAGHADLDWPDAPHLVLWHALALLREHRGDGHVAALAAAELSGIEALISHSATGQGFAPAFARSSRGWTEQEWDAATEALKARGVLDAAGNLTADGQARRAHVEEETDRMAAAPWDLLGEQRTEEVIRIGAALSAVVRAAGAIPAGIFGTGRDRP